MRPSRLLTAPLLLLALAGCKKAPPPERFVSADARNVVLVPSLQAFAEQGTAALDPVAAILGGQRFRDARAIATSRLGFDLLDPRSMSQAGLDPARGAAATDKALFGEGDEGVFILPASDEKKLAATLEAFAKNGLDLQERTAAGTPEVVTLTRGEGVPALFAYAFAEKTAIASIGPGCADRVRAALAVPKDGGLAAAPGFQAALAAAGPKQALLYFLHPPADGELAPGAKQGLAVGVGAAKDRVTFTLGVPLDPASPYLKLAKADAGPLVAKLDPGAAWVGRFDTGFAAADEKKPALEALRLFHLSDKAIQASGDVVDALGGGGAFGLGVLTPPAGATIEKELLSFFRAELVLGVKDPAKIRSVLAAIAQDPENKLKAASPDGPWTFADQGGELGVAVEPQRLLLAVGPAGSLQALVARNGTTFKPPTATAAKAFGAGTAAMYLDVAKLTGGIKAFPVAAYGEGAQAEMIQSAMQQNLQPLSRVAAVSSWGEVKDGALRAELVFELGAPPAK